MYGDSMRRNLTWTLCTCALIIWAGTQSWAYQDDAEKPVGLTGIKAAYAPDGLTAEDFEELSESIDSTWKAWVLETGTVVKDFYESENNTIEGQEAAIQKLRVKLRTMEKALGDRRYQSIHDDLGKLYLTLLPEVDVAEAVFVTLTTDPKAALKTRTAASQKQLNSALAQLRSEMNRISGGDAWLKWTNASALQDFDPANPESVKVVKTIKTKLAKRESYGDEIKKFVSRPTFLALEDALGNLQEALASVKEVDESVLRDELIGLMDAIADYEDDQTVENAAALREQLAVVSSVSPDGGAAISKTYRQLYKNYNLRVVLSEGMLNRVIGDNRRETTGINRNAMGAHVVGSQTANLRLRVDVQPSSNAARFNINLDGSISTNTNAYVSQATIHTVGNHGVSASKPVTFDGTRFSTQAARISVNPNNQPVAARTNYSGGLFGRYAEGVAMREANGQRGQANAYTRQSITSELGKELNSEVDSRFSNASMELQNKVYGPLREFGLYPDAMSVSSTSDHILIRTRLSEDNEMGGGISSPGAMPSSSGMIAQVHESLLTNSMNRLDLGTEGKTEMSEGELRELLQERLSKILDREVKLGEGDNADEGNTFVFDQANPIRFTIEDGEITISLRAGLKREDDDIPTQIITIPLIPTMADGKILINRGNVGVKPVKRPSSVAEQVARANVMRQKIQSALPEKEFDAAFVLEFEDKKIDAAVTSITAENGWLTLTLQ